MNRVAVTMLVLIGALAAPGSAHAQRPAKKQVPTKVSVPKQFQPPEGMCRIWLEGVPLARQPAPTDCGTALRDRPAKGRIVFGDSVPKLRSRPVKRGGRSPEND